MSKDDAKSGISENQYSVTQNKSMYTNGIEERFREICMDMFDGWDTEMLDIAVSALTTAAEEAMQQRYVFENKTHKGVSSSMSGDLKDTELVLIADDMQVKIHRKTPGAIWIELTKESE